MHNTHAGAFEDDYVELLRRRLGEPDRRGIGRWQPMDHPIHQRVEQHCAVTNFNVMDS